MYSIYSVVIILLILSYTVESWLWSKDDKESKNSRDESKNEMLTSIEMLSLSTTDSSKNIIKSGLSVEIWNNVKFSDFA